VQKLIAALDPQTTNRVEIHDIEPFDTLVRGKVALLGDAGHSTTPDIGQGGCAAMEDAVVLGNIFRKIAIFRAAAVRSAALRARARPDTEGAQALRYHARERYGSDPGVVSGAQGGDRERIINGLCETIQGGPLG
jgi:FAD-dependent urate hydroxylase